MRAPRVIFDIVLLALYLVAANGALLVALAFCVVSGAMVSGTLLPSLGFYATGYYFWGPLHALSAKVLLAALLVHIVLRTPAAASVLRRELARENER